MENTMEYIKVPEVVSGKCIGCCFRRGDEDCSEGIDDRPSYYHDCGSEPIIWAISTVKPEPTLTSNNIKNLAFYMPKHKTNLDVLKKELEVAKHELRDYQIMANKDMAALQERINKLQAG